MAGVDADHGSPIEEDSQDLHELSRQEPSSVLKDWRAILARRTALFISRFSSQSAR